ncbi:hypothetical protein JL2886_00970 [Phaeobacter gallaeciensis]|uniref:Thermostable hemolysin n=1 Tax=Phaeobacter gallaeciensis TaxID=60890 RepID=A0A1B0ZNX9_9RHOB|nr:MULTISPECIES: thermostable hemolysin [Phaeobacter]MEE2634050.1 thermostable hemolysin [Pseudomonadota bacterium]ANP35892.1 hypothetical protein JL2886_00970 [Phaeobacter gallaeciensis]MDE4062354.1 thermostable hemolysin [Phaeobacter gallaeciensis]MDE4125228.1 thermostable hemolysin [Phaeobacter gallaeciensis]MDE4129934.1 thermostable hemolysin [Phaeobacter gallaeciensis]
MRIEFLTPTSPGRKAAEAHIRDVYDTTYAAQVKGFAPVLAAASNAEGKILCAAGIRTAQDGFFSDCYLNGDFCEVLKERTGRDIHASQIMEVTSLASVSPFPVLPLLDRMIDWGRQQGVVCGVFTATLPLRRLLTRTGLGYIPLCAAEADRVADPDNWGSYYDTDPWVCAFIETETDLALLTPGTAAPASLPGLQGGAA